MYPASIVRIAEVLTLPAFTGGPEYDARLLYGCTWQVLDARRVRANRADLIPCIVLKPRGAIANASPATGKATSYSAADGSRGSPLVVVPDVNEQPFGPPEDLHNEDGSQDGSQDGSHANRQTGGIVDGLLDLTEIEASEHRGLLGRAIEGWYVPRVVGHPFWQAIILGGFATMLGFGIYGCATISKSLDLQSLVTEGTQLYNFIGLEGQ